MRARRFALRSSTELVSLILRKDSAGLAAADLDASLLCELTGEAFLKFFRHGFFLWIWFDNRW